MALYSLFKIAVLCALFHEAAAAGTPVCSGTRTEANPSSSPDGVYSQSNVEIPGLPAVQVKYIDVVFKQPQPFSGAQTYKLDLDACVVVGGVCMPIPGKDQTFTDGRFIASPVINEGSMFLPRSSDPQNPINQILKIQWCPDQNYFLVAFFGQMLLPLTHPTAAASVTTEQPPPPQPPATSGRPSLCARAPGLSILSTAYPSPLASPPLPSPNSPPPCIDGFETFCEHWANCTTPPASALSSDDGQRCLYSRMDQIDQKKTVLEQNVGGADKKITFISGPDHVAKLAKWHCSPVGRGAATLGVGWTTPSTSVGYWHVVFAAPCPNNKWQDLSGVLHSTEGTELFTFGHGTPRPVSASWPGVAAVVKVVANVTASVKLWKETVRKYSFIGGGLGPAGKINLGKYFQESCRFGDDDHSGCCAEGADGTFQELADAFSLTDVNSGNTDVEFKKAAPLRAWLANSLDLNSFFNGDGYTYDGCYGMYTVLSSTEYLLPNKNGGDWDNPTDTFKVSQLVAARQGLTFTWGPQEFCADTTEGKCDYNDGTILNQTWCEAKYGPLAAPLATYVYGGGGDPVCTRGSLPPL